MVGSSCSGCGWDTCLSAEKVQLLVNATIPAPPHLTSHLDLHHPQAEHSDAGLDVRLKVQAGCQGDLHSSMLSRAFLA